jgi:predicted lipoprotein with Yx(FWY)xxD motif
VKRSLFIALIAAATLGVGASYASTHNPATVVRTAASPLGRIVVDSRGRTLYLFEKDTRTHSACFGACAVYWPPLLTHGTPVGGIGVKRSLLGTVRRTEGGAQVTYAGHRLYLYVGDTRPGQVTGEGSEAFGAGWDALTPTGKKIEKTPG